MPGYTQLCSFTSRLKLNIPFIQAVKKKRNSKKNPKQTKKIVQSKRNGHLQIHPHKVKSVQVCKDGDSASFCQQSHLPAVHPSCTEQAVLTVLTVDVDNQRFSGAGNGTGRNLRAALSLAGVLRALPVGCCSLLSSNQPLLGAKRLSQRSHTDLSPLCSGRSPILLGAGSQ